MAEKVLLVGPYPPPYGGVSVHMSGIRSILERAGVKCTVLNVDPRAPQTDTYIRITGSRDFTWQLFKHAWDQWSIQVHTNGHNLRSWLVALASAAAGQLGSGCRLTLHSGLLPGYLRHASPCRRTLARLACLACDQVTCVNQEIADSIATLGVSPYSITIAPAFLPVSPEGASIPTELRQWLSTRSHVIATVLFFRPEYGFEVLSRAMATLRQSYPRIGCIAMGSGEGQAEAEEMLRVEGLKETIRLTGDLDHQVCLAVMSESTVFVRPTYQDGDSISVREAMSMGLPVVASNVGTRPAGTVLFEAGDVNGLVRGIYRAITARAA